MTSQPADAEKSAARKDVVRVLVVDEDEDCLDQYRRFLMGDDTHASDFAARLGLAFEVTPCRRGDEAIRLVREAAASPAPFAVVFLGDRLPPGLSGWTAAEQLRRHDHDVEIVLAGIGRELGEKELAQAEGPRQKILLVPKPLTDVAVRQAALTLAHKWRLIRGVHGQSRKFQAVLRERDAELKSIRAAMTAEIAKHARTQQELRDTQEHYSRLTQVTQEGVLVFHHDKIVDANPIAEAIFGYRPGEMLGREFLDLYPLDEHSGIQARIDEENPRAMSAVGLRKDGSRFSAELAVKGFYYRNRSMFLAVVQDVTERVDAQQAVRESEERYQGIFEAVGEGIAVLDPKGVSQEVNPAFAEMLGYDRADIIGRPITDWVRSDHHNQFDPAALALVKTARMWDAVRVEAVFLRHDGSEAELEVALMSLVYARRTAVIGIFRDVTEERKAVRALRESESRYRMLAENATDVIWTMDTSLHLTHVSPAVERVYGYTVEEMLSGSMRRMFPEGGTESAEETVRRAIERDRGRDGGGWPMLLEFEQVHHDGRRIWTETTLDLLRDGGGRPTGVIGATRDITQRKRAESEKERLETQLRQAQKMEAIGRLAGGVAHDFNNMLTGILVNSQLILGALDPSHPQRQEAQEIKRAAERAADLTKQLLAFGRKQIISPKPLNLNDVIHLSQKMLGRIIGEDIRREYDLAEDLWTIHADPVQIDQILVNLSVNARDAMPQGGTMRVVTGNASLNEAFCDQHPGCRPGEYVALTVADEGHGMSEDIQKHIFEPFFTTKEKGQGTGLGLATVFGIVKQNSGYIYVDSRPSEGAVFRIYFPRLTGQPESVVPETDHPAAGGTETILVVDDDEMIREIAARVLRAKGYTVHDACSGEEAEDVCQNRGVTPDLLLTDVVMPGINGRELFERLRERHQCLRVLYVSGYPEDTIADHGLLNERTHYLQKPFSVEKLSRLVRDVLDGAPEPASA